MTFEFCYHHFCILCNIQLRFQKLLEPCGCITMVMLLGIVIRPGLYCFSPINASPFNCSLGMSRTLRDFISWWGSQHQGARPICLTESCLLKNIYGDACTINRSLHQESEEHLRRQSDSPSSSRQPFLPSQSRVLMSLAPFQLQTEGGGNKHEQEPGQMTNFTLHLR